MVNEAWLYDGNSGTGKIDEFVCRLEKCKVALMSWSKLVFPNSRKTIEMLTRKLEECRSGA